MTSKALVETLWQALADYHGVTVEALRTGALSVTLGDIETAADAMQLTDEQRQYIDEVWQLIATEVVKCFHEEWKHKILQKVIRSALAEVGL